MNLLKDLTFTKGNRALDIARASAFVSVLAFWGMVAWHHYDKQEFDPIAVGSGIAAIFAGSAGWIHFRQKQEDSNGADNSGS